MAVVTSSVRRVRRPDRLSSAWRISQKARPSDTSSASTRRTPGAKGMAKSWTMPIPPPARIACICTLTEFDVSAAASAPVSAR